MCASTGCNDFPFVLLFWLPVLYFYFLLVLEQYLLGLVLSVHVHYYILDSNVD